MGGGGGGLLESTTGLLSTGRRQQPIFKVNIMSGPNKAQVEVELDWITWNFIYPSSGFLREIQNYCWCHSNLIQYSHETVGPLLTFI